MRYQKATFGTKIIKIFGNIFSYSTIWYYQKKLLELDFQIRPKCLSQLCLNMDLVPKFDISDLIRSKMYSTQHLNWKNLNLMVTE